MIKRVILVLIPLIVVIGGWVWYYEGSLPVSESAQKKNFVVRPGDTADTIAKNLQAQKLIRNKVVFYLLVKKMRIERKIQAGDYELSPSMPPSDIARRLTQGGIDTWVRVVEGLRREEIAAILQKTHGIVPDEFLAVASREGYLFPDSYLVPKNASAQQIASLLESTYEEKARPVIERAVKNTGLSPSEVVILSSLIEREARTPESRAMVARVLLNRLEENMPLQVDATVQYALGYQAGERSWWKRSLTFDDLKINSEYNTYENPGLPPSPIANSGLSAYEAIAGAPDHDYLFYITGKDNKMHYARTYEEHQKNIERFGVQ